MSIYYVYMLKCTGKKSGDVSLYTGSTQDLVIRVNQHQSGKGARYTKGKDVELLYFETHLTRSEAMKREYAIKQLTTEKKWNLIRDFQLRMEQGSE
ncbi:MAG: GIY-YIG nuclease family protein [Promethearchaeota archaeon]